MSNPTIAGSSRRTLKATCPKCRRTVVVVEIDGAKIATDPELMTVVPFEVKPSVKILARRSHDENCERYRVEEERRKIKILARAHRGKAT